MNVVVNVNKTNFRTQCNSDTYGLIFALKQSFFSFPYRKLDNNLEEAMADNSDDTVRHVIY